MTTNHHTDIATGATANAATINSPLGELDAAISIVKGIEKLSAASFGITNATPSAGFIGASVRGMSTWRMDDTTTEAVGAGFVYLGDAPGSTIEVDVYWAADSATSGGVTWNVTLDALAEGDDATAAFVDDFVTETVPGTAKLLAKTTFSSTVSYVSGDLIRLTVSRWSSLGTDTATGDVHFIAAVVRFV